MPVQTRWSLEELRKESGVGRVVMRSFVRDGYLPHPGFGRGSGYNLENRLRLLALVKLRTQGFSGPALKAKLDADAEEKKQQAIAPAAESQVSTWMRVGVAPGVELHIDLTRADSSQTAGMFKALRLKLK